MYFSIVQKKVVSPNDFASTSQLAATLMAFTGLDQIRGRLAAFETRYNAIARPFTWKFTRTDLGDLLRRIDTHVEAETHALAA